jgi:diketogulonate reductase-like aldo/keto reductase
VGECIASSGIPRSEIFVTTKVWVANYPESRFVSSVDESLKKLRSEYIDLLLLHWPHDGVPLAEQIGLLNETVRAAKSVISASAISIGDCSTKRPVSRPFRSSPISSSIIPI